MYRLYCVCFLFLRLSFNSQAQVTEIKASSGSFSVPKSSNSSRESFRGSANKFNDIAALIYVFQFGYQFIVSGFQYQKYLVESRKEENPRILSLDLMPNIAYPVPNNSVLLMPRARANWGLISTDFRYSHLYEFGVGKYATLDWQIVQFNIVSKYNTYIRIGAGLAREVYAARNFVEYGFNTDFKIVEKTSLILEGRYAPNFRTELGLQIGYTLNQTEKSKTQLTVGFMYQNYFLKTNLYNAQLGLIYTVW